MSLVKLFDSTKNDEAKAKEFAEKVKRYGFKLYVLSFMFGRTLALGAVLIWDKFFGKEK